MTASLDTRSPPKTIAPVSAISLPWYRLGNTQLYELAFFLMIFLYPFIVLGHALYLMPQAGLMLWGLHRIRGERRIGRLDVCLILCLSAAASFPLLREGLDSAGDYSQAIKLVINGSFVILAGKSGLLQASPRCLIYLRLCALAWAAIILSLYMTASGGPAAVFVQLVADDLSSQQLYQAADPLSKVFLTKNISAMYFVAIFGLYLFNCACLHRKPFWRDVALFSLLIVAFLSRQAVLALIAVLALQYFLRNLKNLRAYILALAGALGLGLFFYFFFNLNSANDGASQRLQLWQDFFAQVHNFWFAGMTFDGMSDDLIVRFGIDNYHMFFMNQIATYGLIHMLTFNIAVLLAFVLSGQIRLASLILLFCYYFNVLFQTYGYEFQNLLLVAVAYADSSARQLQDNKARESEHSVPTLAVAQ